jgi:hypothetical protein
MQSGYYILFLSIACWYCVCMFSYSSRRSHRIICWWCLMQLFRCFCLWRGLFSEVLTCPCPCLSPSCWSVSAPQADYDMRYVSLVSCMSGLSFSSWLQASHTDVAYRHEKPKNMHAVKIVAVPCLRSFFVIVVKLVVSGNKRWNCKCQLLILSKRRFWHHYLALIFSRPF